jgi:hypothetical protein
VERLKTDVAVLGNGLHHGRGVNVSKSDVGT